MIKTYDTLSEIPHTTKNQFRKAENLPGKAQRHRYERRKIKELMRVGDWQEEHPA